MKKWTRNGSNGRRQLPSQTPRPRHRKVRLHYFFWTASNKSNRNAAYTTKTSQSFAFASWRNWSSAGLAKPSPLVERQKQIEAELPRLEAEVDILKVNTLSAEEIALQASNLYDHWQTMQPAEKREIIEVITDKIMVGKDEITINLSYAPSCKDMANRWRKGWDSNPR